MKNASFDPSEDFWIASEEDDETDSDIFPLPSSPSPRIQIPPDETCRILLPDNPI